MANINFNLAGFEPVIPMQLQGDGTPTTIPGEVGPATQARAFPDGSEREVTTFPDGRTEVYTECPDGVSPCLAETGAAYTGPIAIVGSLALLAGLGLTQLQRRLAR